MYTIGWKAADIPLQYYWEDSWEDGEGRSRVVITWLSSCEMLRACPRFTSAAHLSVWLAAKNSLSRCGRAVSSMLKKVLS